MFYYKTRKQYIKLQCPKIMQNVSQMCAESAIRPRDRQQPGMTDHMLVTPSTPFHRSPPRHCIHFFFTGKSSNCQRDATDIFLIRVRVLHGRKEFTDASNPGQMPATQGKNRQNVQLQDDLKVIHDEVSIDWHQTSAFLKTGFGTFCFYIGSSLSRHLSRHAIIFCPSMQWG